MMCGRGHLPWLLLGLSSCFNPDSSSAGTDTDAVSSTGEPMGTGSSGGMSSATSPATSTSPSDSSGANTTMPATTSLDGTESTGDDPPETTTTGASTGDDAASSSGGEPMGDPDGPYGDCDPEAVCPLNGPLGCAGTDEGLVCLPSCKDNAGCPPVDGPTPAFCTQLVGGESGCLILCQQDAHCPTGMSCQSGFGNADICAWG